MSRAILKHSKLIWQWRNDICTRSMFRNSEPIPWEDHEAWFLESLESSNRFIYIGSFQGNPSGVVRFDFVDGSKGEYQISINVAPEFRGVGIGKQLLSKGIHRLGHDSEVLNLVTAEVKNDNLASEALFLSAGFVKQVNKDDGNQRYKLIVA